jgi:hypothetical protein
MVRSMTRANRLDGVGVNGGVWHLTHQFHSRTFLLKFARDRDSYRDLVRQHLKGYDLLVLDYCITCIRNIWCLQEESIPYGQKTGLKTAANDLR